MYVLKMELKISLMVKVAYQQTNMLADPKMLNAHAKMSHKCARVYVCARACVCVCVLHLCVVVVECEAPSTPMCDRV